MSNEELEEVEKPAKTEKPSVQGLNMLLSHLEAISDSLEEKFDELIDNITFKFKELNQRIQLLKERQDILSNNQQIILNAIIGQEEKQKEEKEEEAD